MKRVQKKILSLLMAAMLMVMIVPVTAEAAAAGTMTGEQLLAEADNNGVITLTGDVGLLSTMEVPAGQSITLKLNGHNITIAPANYAVKNLGTFVLEGDGTISSRGLMNGASDNNIGTMTINGGKILANSSTGGASINNYGEKVTVNGGTLTTLNTAEKDPACVMNKSNGQVILNSCTIGCNTNLAYAVQNLSDGTIVIEKDVTVTGKHGAVYARSGSVTVNGASLTTEGISGQSDHVVFTEGNGNITLNGGNYTINDASAGSCGVYVDGGEITIKDGTFNGGTHNANAANGSLKISGGTFKGSVNQGNGSISISGGTFKENPEEEWIADGVEKNDNGDGTWTVIDPNAPAGGEGDNGKSESGSSTGCTSHNYAWEQTNAATTTKDGEKVYRCQNCGHVADKVKISAYGVFLEEVTEKIKNAPAGSVVEIKTDLWVSFSKAVAAALQANPTVTLVVEFFYDGHVFQIIIPAGYDLMAKMNEDGYAGFAYLATDPALKLMWLR